MSEPLSVKIAKSAPAGATAVAEAVYSDRLNKVPGVRKAVLDRSGFRGQPGETMLLDDGETTRVLMGLGPVAEVGSPQLRRGAACVSRAVSRHRRIALELPGELDIDPAEAVRALTEGLVLGSYRFDVHKGRPLPPSTVAATIAVGDKVRAVQAGARQGRATAEAVCFARDLVNEPGGSLTPTVFVERVSERAAASGVQVDVMDEAAIADAGLGGLLAVNQGSVEPPRLLQLTYEPATPTSPDTVALVGKGITFDSGGLSLKTADGMTDMKCDMAGAAAVVAAMCALGSLEVGVRVVAYTPLTDNMTGGSAQRPGDVFTARNGTTVEVLNTDAEGRLVLADALCLANEQSPAAIVDLATLTGACMVALGSSIAGLMGNDEVFSGVVEQAAEDAGERVWQLPLPADYRRALDSPVADLKNIGGGRYGGALTAGLFLKEFVDDATPWVHLDIAGPAFLSEADGEAPKGGTGFGVRTLLRLLEDWQGADGGSELDDLEIQELEITGPSD